MLFLALCIIFRKIRKTTQNVKKMFGMELLALLGYFQKEMRLIPGFQESLKSLGEVFQPFGEIQQLLTTSKRFTDQLDDMFIDKAMAHKLIHRKHRKS